ncbi:MAG: winged helix-turn-helix transcriptional regulator [Candidatus Bathyarchaeota archaeon]|nr:winged helix-turn-helix transcriptional regulator [Candidatus Bathyarchaeota archaeon]
MMKEILRLIHDTGVTNMSEIAEKIGVSQSMVEQAIAMLKSKSYLETPKTPKNSSVSCGNCASCRIPCKSNQTNLSPFFVTEKGKRYLGYNSASVF